MPSFLERIIGHISGVAPGSSTTPSRALDTAFTPSASSDVLCQYTIQMVITTGQTATVVANSDSAATPTTARCSATSNIIGTIRQELVFVCKKGENVKLVSSGTGASTIAHQTETPIS